MMNTGAIENYVKKSIGELHNISISLKRIAEALEVQNANQKKEEAASRPGTSDSNRK